MSSFWETQNSVFSFSFFFINFKREVVNNRSCLRNQRQFYNPWNIPYILIKPNLSFSLSLPIYLQFPLSTSNTPKTGKISCPERNKKLKWKLNFRHCPFVRNGSRILQLSLFFPYYMWLMRLFTEEEKNRRSGIMTLCSQ